MQQAHEEFHRKTDNNSRREHEKISKLEKKVLSVMNAPIKLTLACSNQMKRLQHDLEIQTQIVAEADKFRALVTSFANKGHQASPSPETSSASRTPCHNPVVIQTPQNADPSSPIFRESFGSVSSSKGGSTPKRPKTMSRRSFKTPPLSSRNISVSNKKLVLKTAKVGNAGAPRQALNEVRSSSASNTSFCIQSTGDKTQRRHTSVALPAKSIGTITDNNVSLDNLSFNNSDLFTSTTRERLDIIDDENAQHSYDDGTTVDI